MSAAEVISDPIGSPTPVAPLSYRAGLDGLRAVSVALVVLFHLGAIDGGNLGVDAFFVISGWLITWRLLAEHDRTGRITLRHFWAARVRRLMPASLAVIAAVVVVWPILGIEVASLRRDALFATFWSSNWGTITGGGDYWARFGEVSPLTHFWSLAIEEQFYLVWPLVVVGVALVARRRNVGPRTAISITAAVLAAASIVFMLTSFDPADRTGTYMNTFARAHTLLIGAAAGAFTLDRGGSLRGAPVARRLAPAAALAALVLIAISSERSDWLYHWGFPVFAVAAMIVVVAVGDGLWGRVLAARPMRWVGNRSYAIYLWHWPVIVLLDETRLYPRRRIGGARPPVVRVPRTAGAHPTVARRPPGPARCRSGHGRHRDRHGRSGARHEVERGDGGQPRRPTTHSEHCGSHHRARGCRARGNCARYRPAGCDHRRTHLGSDHDPPTPTGHQGARGG
jgi:peptidoglycan/LPS O-acetylase OafA/YrhL